MIKGIIRILEKITGTDDNLKFQRNAKQNWRILQEFPWLWAIHRYWLFTDLIIRVTNDDPSVFFSQRVDGGIGINDDLVYGVWIHATRKINGRPMEFVDPIWDGKIDRKVLCASMDTRWHNLLLSRVSAHDGVEILHIAVIYWGGDAITIYRPKSSPSFNLAIRSFGVGEM